MGDKKRSRELTSFSDHVRTSFIPHPDLVQSTRRHIDACPRSKRLLLAVAVVGVGDRERTGDNKVRGEISVCVRRIVRVPV
jgi:hypothetical protein